MKNKFKISIFIFRRDLRIEDNTGLIKAGRLTENVIPCFIFDPRQLENNPYFSDNAFQFMIEAVSDLNRTIEKQNGRLYIFYAKPEEIIERLIQSKKVEAVFINKDYTPFSKDRDNKIKNVCDNYHIPLFVEPDHLLTEPEDITAANGKPYMVFTRFFKKVSDLAVKEPQKYHITNFYTENIEFENRYILSQFEYKKNTSIHVHGLRNNFLNITGNMNKFKFYERYRDYPAMESTTNLSAFLKFGLGSVRESYYSISDELGVSHALIRQLFWRDFFTHTAYHFPHVFGESFHKKFNRLTWNNDEKTFLRWCNGETGFPIVDAGMRQLNSTGFMHNRIRMISACFLTKDLHIDWRQGEKYFAQKLVDYDPCINNGNWQWVASTGCDAQPYFRIFNPWIQQQKFDGECKYIKKWVPELKNIPAEQIHRIFETDVNGYPRPIVDHKRESEITRDIYSKIS